MEDPRSVGTPTLKRCRTLRYALRVLLTLTLMQRTFAGEPLVVVTASAPANRMKAYRRHPYRDELLTLTMWRYATRMARGRGPTHCHGRKAKPLVQPVR